MNKLFLYYSFTGNGDVVADFMKGKGFAIKKIVSNYSSGAILKENGIKARQIGPCWDIDLILKFREDITICECHRICDEIENQIQNIYVNSSISIHSEPVCYSKECHNTCTKECNTLKEISVNEQRA